MQVDIGFGDVIFPKPKTINYPAILDFPSPHLKGYTVESVVAEKFEAMIKLGRLNSRMKDFYDLWFLSRRFDFDGATLHKAIHATFARRQTVLSDKLPHPLTDAFGKEETKQTQWTAFLGKNKLTGPCALGD